MVFKSRTSTHSTLFILVFISLALQQVFADSRVTLGGTSVSLTAPSGFREVGVHKYYGRAFFESLVPSDSRLLAAYISEDDLIALKNDQRIGVKRYMMAISNKEIEPVKLAEHDFAEIADATIASHNRLYEEIQAEIKEGVESASERMSKQIERDVEVGVQQVTPVEETSRTPDSVSTQLITTYGAVSQGKSITFEVASGNNFVLLRQKAVILTVLSEYQDSTDLDWVRNTSRQWIKDLLTANPQP